MVNRGRSGALVTESWMQRRGRACLSNGVVAALMLVAGMAVSAASAADLQTMSAPDIYVLQRRLTDVGCYTGPLDGTASPATEAAVNACPLMDPMLSIETGMHTAPIRGIGVDRACRLLATGSDDKTVRLWSLPEGRLLRKLRPPIGPGDDGKIHAVALSPDGLLVAASGLDVRWSSRQRTSVYLFDAATGELKARVGEFESLINHLTFSVDGRFLAVTLRKGGLRVIDTEHMNEVAADRDYGGGAYGAAFAPGGQLFTVADDGYLRAYDTSFQLVRKVPGHGGWTPLSVAVDPAGERLAVSFYDRQAVEVYRTSDLSFSFAADTTGNDRLLDSVAWSLDGQRLVAAGRFQMLQNDGVWRKVVLLWDHGGQGARHEQGVSIDTITQILPCDSGFAVGASDPLFALLNSDGTLRLSASEVIADMRGKLGNAFRASRDGKQILFGLGTGNVRPVLFDLARGILRPDAMVPGLATPIIANVPVTDWQDNTAPKLAGKDLKLDLHEMSRSLAITPDGERFALGTQFRLRAFDARAQEQWSKPGPGEVWGVNVTGDGRLVLTAYGDGTIRWNRMSDGQELLALFVNKDDLRWIAWTPSGYYMASPGGEDLIGWHLNRGWDQAADFFGASRFRERFSRPDVVLKVLDTLDEGQAIKEANTEARRREDTKPIITQLPPVIRLLSPGDGFRFSGNDLAVNYELRSPSGIEVTRVDALVDGRISRGVEPNASPCKGASAKACTGSFTLSLPAQDVEVALIAYAGELASEPARVRLAWAGAAVPPANDLLKPNLYALIVGVSDYAAPNLKLGYAAEDAGNFATALQNQRGGLYGVVETRLITDRDATRSSVVEGLEWLEKQVTSRDVGVVFIAGHGVSDEKQNYWFLPADAIPERMRTTAVSQYDIKRTLQALPGKALLFLDTCHAGQAMANGTRRGTVDVNALVNELSAAENGVIAFASSTGREVSTECDDWNNGAFAKAIVEGLVEGRADLLRNGAITLSELDAYVANRVKTLTGGEQRPVLIRPSTVPDFPIALIGAR
jgi:WD40 repeat protein